MRIVIQRSKESNVTVANKVIGSIKDGLVILVGFTFGDSLSDIDYIVKKIVNLRIFDDENHIMNRSILDTGGSILSISQFTLYADTNNGNRPSYSKALKAEEAVKLYELFNEKLKMYEIPVATGCFGASMSVNIVNDGPVTIILESGDKGDKKKS